MPLNQYQKFVKQYSKQTGLSGPDLMISAAAEWRRISGKPKGKVKKRKTKDKKGGFLASLAAGVAAPIIYDVINDNLIKKKKKKRKKKGGLLYRPRG